jgi:hypothetical protein
MSHSWLSERITIETYGFSSFPMEYYAEETTVKLQSVETPVGWA